MWNKVYQQSYPCTNSCNSDIQAVERSKIDKSIPNKAILNNVTLSGWKYLN